MAFGFRPSHRIHSPRGWRRAWIECLEPRRVFESSAGLAEPIDLTSSALQWAGDVLSAAVHPAESRVDFALENGAAARLQFLESDIVRIRVDPLGTFLAPSSSAISLSGLIPTSISVSETASQVQIQTAAMTAIVQKSPFGVRLQRADGHVIVQDAAASVAWDVNTGQILNQKLAPPDEHYFGMGLRGGPVDRRGRAFLMRNSDVAAYSELADPLYSSTPFYYGVRQGQAYGVFVDNPAFPFFDFDSGLTGHATFGAAEGELNYYVLAGPQPQQVATDFAKLTGFNPLPALWTLGYHQSRYGYYSYGEIQTLANWFREYDIPVDSFWLDLNYTHNNHLFTYHPETYPNPVANNAALAALGLKLVAIVDSALKTTDPLYGGYDGSDLFVKDAQTGESYISNIFLGPVSWIDFSQTAAAELYKQQLTAFLGTGIDAIWNDLNEPADNNMPGAIHGFDGAPRTDRQARNLYALLETRATFDAMQAARPDTRPFVLSRSVYPGIQRYAANWSGDNVATWDSMRVSVQMTASMGLSGQNFFGHDIGGYLGSPPAELFTRWLQFAALTPFFRNHAYITEAYREPYQFGEPWTSINRTAIEMRYRLLPYVYTLAHQASTTATPIAAPTMFHFPADPATYDQDSEFMLGPSLLVAPVFTPGAASRTLYLPQGADWVDYHTGQKYAGGQQVTVAAPIDRIPMLVRAGSIIPSGPVRQFVGDPSVQDRLELDIYESPRQSPVPVSFELYEDDGNSLAFRKGFFRTTRVTSTAGLRETSILIEKSDGKLPDAARPVHLNLHHRPGRPYRVRVAGMAIPEVPVQADLATSGDGWHFRAADGVLVVRLADPPETVSVTVDQRIPFAARPGTNSPLGRLEDRWSAWKAVEPPGSDA